MASAEVVDVSAYVVPVDTPVSRLEAGDAFEGLTDKEKLYCHYLSRASWEGAAICLLQTSPESVPIYLLLGELFSRQPDVASLREAACSKGVAGEEFQALLVYASAFFSNMGNYKSFGDTKFIPGLSKEKFHAVLLCSELCRTEPELLERLWTACADAIFSLTQRETQLGFKEEGITTYYSCNCSASDAELVQQFMKDKSIEPYNTRLFKTTGQDDTTEYELRIASAVTSTDPCDPEDDVAAVLGTHSLESASLLVTRGDFAPLMQRIVSNLAKAKGYASNELEVAMLECYIQSFTSGSVQAHKEGSRHWIRNKGPIVETYIGFIETYRDPFGIRAEYEGFVAVVNKAMSAKFSALVSSASSLLPQLPWPAPFEKDTFLRPDFTSLDVVTFASSGIPAGINIPNYDEIRQNEGFKNVSLGNVLSAAYSDKRVSFLPKEDEALFVELRGPAFEVQVGLHELLGHGSGKLFQQDKEGGFNFDPNTINPLTGEKVSSWYGPGDTWDNMFRAVASSYEECRAECVGIYLCLCPDVLSVFGYEGSAAEDIVYVNWLNMVRAGLLALEFYSPETKKWRQAHMQARYVILRVLLETAPGLVSIERREGSDGRPDAVVRLERSKLETLGKTAIGDFLKRLQVLKSVADVSSGEALYSRYSAVTEEEGGWLSLRETVLARKMPRRMLVQSLTTPTQDGGSAVLEQFEASVEGIIECHSRQASQRGYHTQLEALWENDRKLWTSQ